MGIINKMAAAGAVAAVGAIAINREAVKKVVRGLLHKTETAAGQLAERAESALAPVEKNPGKPASKPTAKKADSTPKITKTPETPEIAARKPEPKVTQTARKAKAVATKATSTATKPTTATAAARKATATPKPAARKAR